MPKLHPFRTHDPIKRKLYLSSLYGTFGKTMPKKSKPTPSTVGSRIAKALSSLNLSIAGLASKSKLSASFMSLVVSDKRQLSPEHIPTVAKVLGIKPSLLLSDDQRETLKALQAVASAKA